MPRLRSNLSNVVQTTGIEPAWVSPLDPKSSASASSATFASNGADDRTRTYNLLITNQLLCQLSHVGVK